jgi:hypothetical protein
VISGARHRVQQAGTTTREESTWKKAEQKKSGWLQGGLDEQQRKYSVLEGSQGDQNKESNVRTDKFRGNHCSS